MSSIFMFLHFETMYHVSVKSHVSVKFFTKELKVRCTLTSIRVEERKVIYKRQLRFNKPFFHFWKSLQTSADATSTEKLLIQATQGRSVIHIYLTLESKWMMQGNILMPLVMILTILEENGFTRKRKATTQFTSNDDQYDLQNRPNLCWCICLWNISLQNSLLQLYPS